MEPGFKEREDVVQDCYYESLLGDDEVKSKCKKKQKDNQEKRLHYHIPAESSADARNEESIASTSFCKTRLSKIIYCGFHDRCRPWHLVHLVLSDCNIQDAIIPYDLSHLWSVEHLDLSGNLMCGLPKSIKSLSKLRNLLLDRCKILQSLSELPEGLELLSLEDCPSLKVPSFFFFSSQLHPLLRYSLLDYLVTNRHKTRSAFEKYPHECFLSLRVLERVLPGIVEKLQFLIRLRKFGIFSIFQFKARDNQRVYQLEGQRVKQIHAISEYFPHVESTSSPIDILPRYLVELDLKDCNISDNHSIFKNLICLCSLKYLNLSGNLMTTLPESIRGLAKLQSLRLSRCKMLQSLPELPAGLEKLKLNCCSLLQKVVNLPNLFRSLMLDVRNCASLVEIQELFMLKPMETVDVDSICYLHLLEDIEVSMFNFMTYSSRKSSVQILYECGIVSVYLPGTKFPNWFNYHVKGGSSLGLIIPSLVADKTWSLNLFVVYSLSYMSDYNGLPLLLVKVSNKTKGLKWTYCPTCIGIPREGEDVLWFSHWKFKDQLESGDHVEISFAYSAEFSIKQYGVDFVFGDKEVDAVSDEEAAVHGSPLHEQTLCDVDISVYKVQHPAKEVQGTSYLLSNHHYPSSDKFWLAITCRFHLIVVNLKKKMEFAVVELLHCFCYVLWFMFSWSP